MSVAMSIKIATVVSNDITETVSKIRTGSI